MSAGQTAAARSGFECRACASATAAAAAPADPEALPTATLDFFVPESPQSPALSDQFLAPARAIRPVLKGQSLSDPLEAAPAALPPPAQALSFHAIRRLGHPRSVS